MINPKSLENLKPFDTMDRERHREISRRGGIASAKARRRQKEQREAMHAIMHYGGAIQALLDISEMSPAQIRKLIKKSR